MLKLSLFLLLFQLSCQLPGQVNKSNVFYTLNDPDYEVALPDKLVEVSDIAFVSGENIACVQDEKGDIFIYDVARRMVVAQYDFSKDGDYEGIAVVDSIFYILRSDGRLYEIVNFDRPDAVTNSYTLDLPSKDNEGLCFDEVNNRLLISPKSKPDEDFSEDKDQRFIHAFDLTTKQLSEQPVLSITKSEIKRFLKENKLTPVPKITKKGKEKKRKINFETSAIDIHPGTQDIYVLSAEEFLLYVFNQKGSLKSMVVLNPELHFKPEGLCFLPDGRLVITNEGGNHPAMILVYSQK